MQLHSCAAMRDLQFEWLLSPAPDVASLPTLPTPVTRLKNICVPAEVQYKHDCESVKIKFRIVRFVLRVVIVHSLGGNTILDIITYGIAT